MVQQSRGLVIVVLLSPRAYLDLRKDLGVAVGVVLAMQHEIRERVPIALRAPVW